jgi:hypothetical protein
MARQTRGSNPQTAIIIGLLSVISLCAQPATFPTTTLAAPVAGWPSSQPFQNRVLIANPSLIIPGINPISTSGIGDPTGHTNQILMVDQEAMCVTGPLVNGYVPVNRGCQGSYVQGHAMGATVWVGFPSYYPLTVPSGACNVNALPVLPVLYIENAGVYNCVNGSWLYEGQASLVTPGITWPPVWHAAPRRKPWYRRVFGL